MSLKDKLFSDLKESMKNKEAVRKDTIQLIRAGILQIEKDEQITANDDDILRVITKEVKKCNDVYPDYLKSGRQNALDEIDERIKILKSYLPEQLSDDDILKIVVDTIAECNASSMKDMGNVMKALGPKLNGRADNKKVSEFVKSNLK